MKKLSLGIPIFYLDYSYQYRKQFYKNYNRYIDSDTDVTILLMNTDESMANNIVKENEWGSGISVYLSRINFDTFNARAVLSTLINYLGYDLEHLLDDDDCLTDSELGMWSIIKSKYLLGHEINFEESVLGLRMKRKPKSKCLAFDSNTCLFEGKVDDKLITYVSGKKYKNKIFEYQTNRQMNRTHRGLVAKSGTISCIARNAKQLLLDKDSYTPNYTTYEDTLWFYAAKHLLDRKVLFSIRQDDLNIWSSDEFGGNIYSTIVSSESNNNKSKSNPEEYEKLCSQLTCTYVNNMSNLNQILTKII